MRVDQLFLSLAVPAAVLGNYGVAVSYSLLINPLSAAVANVAFARVASARAVDKASHIRDVLSKGLVTSAAGIAVLWGLRTVLIPRLYGHGFGEAVKLTPVLCLAALFLGANYILGDCLRGLNLPGYVSKAETFSTIITLIGLYFAIPRFGAMGAACVSLAAYGAVTAILVSRLIRPLPEEERTSLVGVVEEAALAPPPVEAICTNGEAGR